MEGKLTPKDILKMSRVKPPRKKKKKKGKQKDPMAISLSKTNAEGNQRLLRFVHLVKQNDVYRLDCHVHSENCDKIKTKAEIAHEAGYTGKSSPVGTQGYKELMAGWEDEIQARATGNVALDQFDKKMEIISNKALSISELSSELLIKAMEKKFEDPEFIDKMSEMGMEKLANVLNKTAKTSQLLAGKATENVAVGVKIEVSPQRADTMSIFQEQNAAKAQHKKESAEKARQQIIDAELEE